MVKKHINTPVENFAIIISGDGFTHRTLHSSVLSGDDIFWCYRYSQAERYNSCSSGRGGITQIFHRNVSLKLPKYCIFMKYSGKTLGEAPD